MDDADIDYGERIAPSGDSLADRQSSEARTVGGPLPRSLIGNCSQRAFNLSATTSVDAEPRTTILVPTAVMEAMGRTMHDR